MQLLPVRQEAYIHLVNLIARELKVLMVVIVIILLNPMLSRELVKVYVPLFLQPFLPHPLVVRLIAVFIMLNQKKIVFQVHT